MVGKTGLEIKNVVDNASEKENEVEKNTPPDVFPENQTKKDSLGIRKIITSLILGLMIGFFGGIALRGSCKTPCTALFYGHQKRFWK